MHLLKNARAIPMGDGIALQPGQWLCEDSDAAQMMAHAGGGECHLEHFATVESLAGHSDEAGSITIVRPGRYGDLILLTPCLREIKRRWPKCTLQISCLPHYREALLGLPYVDNFLPYPLPMHAGEDYGMILSLEVLASLCQREAELHITDLFAERLGLDGIENKKPDFALNIHERAWALDAYPRTKKRRVAVQVKSSTPSRDYPSMRMGDVTRMLFGRGWDVMFLGVGNQVIGDSKPRLTNCAADKLTFRQSAAVLASSDVFLGPDSSMIHVAGALEIPALGLFSVVPHELRTIYCPTTEVMQATKGCTIAPCFHAPRGAMGFPAAGPCQKSRKCCALDNISPHDVVDAVERLAKQHE